MNLLRFQHVAIFLVALAACSAPATAADLPPQSRDQIEQSAVRVGQAMIKQGQNAADIQKLIATYVRNEYAQLVNPQNPEAPLSDSYNSDINTIVADVLKQLGNSQPVQPTPVVVPPVPAPNQPTRPVDPPVTPPAPVVKPGQNPTQPNNNVVWVFVPIAPAAPVHYAPPGRPPVITIHRGWFGHSGQVRYSWR